MAAVVYKSSKTAQRLLSYCVSLNKFRCAFFLARSYSGFENSDEAKTANFFQEESGLAWPDEFMGPLSPQNKNFPLPGNIGIPLQNQPSTSINTYIPPKDILEGAANCDRHLTIVSQLIAESDYMDDDCEMSSEGYDIADTIIREYFDQARVELAIQDCPKVLYKDFASIFVAMPKANITVITITQKSDNDMSGWSENVEAEREKLLANFISTATEICQLLKANGFWCDFIDPSSGQAYFGAYTNSTLFETDDRYNSLGFHIEDLGCCKVITHKQWGANVFVGSIVTSAHKHHKVLKKLLQDTLE